MNCIIIEDEINAQEVLLHYINETPYVTCLGTFESAIKVPSALLEKVHFIFLDVELPVINGLAFLRTLSNPPKVIITTAYPDFAIEAFEQAVVDYLVKPFAYERFLQAVGRIRASETKDQQEFVLIYANKTTHKVKVAEIFYIKSELDYVNVYTNSETIMVLESLTSWEERLKAYGFLRIHRSYVVNGHLVRKIHPNKVEIGSNSIPIGPTYKDTVEQTLKQNLL